VTCIVLAGGFGTRLRDRLGGRPKCLAPVGSTSFLALLLRQLAHQGVDDVVLSLGHLADQVVQAAQEARLGAAVRWVVEPEPLGTAGAVAFAMDSLGLEEALVTNGDTYLDGGLEAMHPPLDQAAGEQLRMALVAVPDRGRFGGVELEHGQVRRFIEKGQEGPGLINAGMYRLSRAALGLGRGEAGSLETQVLPRLMALGPGAVTGVRLDGGFIDIGVPADYERFLSQHAA
jgi:D-glycero-alpha-D-manno-heptose 1-phosphate guanylyltransferase